jgi:PBSX family phage terminase large subunit
MRKLKPPFQWGPISPKQLEAMFWWNMPENKDLCGVIAEGSVRSGKTVSIAFGFVLWALDTFGSGELFGAAGKTIGTLRKNVIGPLKNILKSRRHANGKAIFSIRDSRSENTLYIYRGKKSIAIELFGGQDEGSQDFIQGRTLAGMLFDEVTLMPESFVEQAIARCSVTGSTLWFNCNPESPYHWFFVKFVKQAKRKGLLILHFTMKDNLTLSDIIRKRYETMYSGVFYKRFVEGLWVAASGVVYDMFDTEKNVTKRRDFPLTEQYVAVDYGTSNPCVFLHGGVYTEPGDPEPHIVFLNEYYYDSRAQDRQKSDSQYADDMEDFYLKTGLDRSTVQVIIDPSANSFSVELKGRGFRVVDGENAVLDGIRCVSSQLSTGRMLVHEDCASMLMEIMTYAWDTRSQRRGVDLPLKESDHAMDAMRYLVYTIAKGKLQQLTSGQYF